MKRIIALMAATLAFTFPVVFGASAHANTVPSTRISWNGQDACLGVLGPAQAGQDLGLLDCSSNPFDPAEAWVLGDGHLRLHGTDLWAVVNLNGSIVLSENPGRAYWVYGPTHTIHIGIGWLSSTGLFVFYSAKQNPFEQTWYAFTSG